jgi:hypothetical protein
MPPAAPGKSFNFQAHANSLGGILETPHKKVVPSQACVALPSVGGHAATRTESFNCDEIVSCKAAYSRVTGGQGDDEGHWSTVVTSVVEGLNILETVKADRIVAQISVEHPKDGGNPTFSLAGCHFEGLRLGGCLVSPTLDPKLLGVDSLERIGWSIFHKTGQQQAGKMIATAEAHPGKNSQWITDRFQWMTKPKEGSCVLCSLVTGFDPPAAVPGRAFGHALEIPHFGKVFLGELLVCPSSIQLSMIRAELGCAHTGHVSGPTASAIGGTIPPT